MNGLNQNRNVRAGILTWSAAAVLVATGALLAGSGDLRGTAVVMGAFIGAFLLLKPSLSLWFVIIGGMIFAGLAQLYFPQIQFIRWSIGLLAAVLGAVAICDYLFRDATSGPKQLPPIFWFMTAFIGIALISSALNYNDFDTFVFGAKGYFQVWGLFFAIVLMSWRIHTVDRIPKVLMAIAFVQLPFAVHQFLFIRPARIHIGEGVVAEDVIAGTLGASATGGGANAVLSALLLIVIAILTALYKRKLMSAQRLLAAVLILLVPIILNASKISLLYLVVAYVMLFSREILRRPVKAIVMGVFSAVFFLAIFWSYSTLVSRSEEASDWRSFIAQTVAQNTAEDYGYGAYELNRWTALTFWMEEHRDRGLDKTLFGHGVGAAREGEGGVMDARTLARREYAGIGIGLTAVSAVLWELGIVGLALLFFVLWTTYRSAGWLARFYDDNPWRAGVFHGLQVGIVILGISLFHKDSFVRHLPYQTLFVLVVGYIGYWHARATAEASARRRAGDATRHGIAVSRQSGQSV